MKVYQYIKKQKGSSQNKKVVYTRLSHKNETPFQRSSDISVLPSEWDDHEQKIIGDSFASRRENKKLSDIRSLLEFEIPMYLESAGISPTLKEIKNEYDKRFNKKTESSYESDPTVTKTLLSDIFNQKKLPQNKGLSNGLPVTKRTDSTKNSAISKILEFIIETKSDFDVVEYSFNNSDPIETKRKISKKWASLITGFNEYLSSFSQNTAFTYDSILFSTLREFETENYLNLNLHALKKYSIPQESFPVEVIDFNTHKFLIKDYDKIKMRMDNIEQIAFDYSIVASLICFRVSDLVSLNSSDFVVQKDGDSETWTYKTVTQKTREIVYLRLPDIVVRIFKRNLLETGLLLPKVAMTVLLRKLKTAYAKIPEMKRDYKRIRNVSGVRKVVSEGDFSNYIGFHLFRRTAITSMLIQGVPESVVKTFSGHSGNSKSFDRYVAYVKPFVNRESQKYFESIQA